MYPTAESLPQIASALSSVQPKSVAGELAVYDQGQGAPVLLMPYPHGYTLAPMIESPLAALLLKNGKRVITYDPPGTYRSTRRARISMQEMLETAAETLDTAGVSGPVDIVGHSMGSLCALAFALYLPRRIRRLVLVGSATGGPSILRYGMPRCWPWWSPNFWQYLVWGFLLMNGRGSLALHKRHHQLVIDASFVDRAKAPRIQPEAGDEQKPAPPRDGWPAIARQLDYRPYLNKITFPTLVCVGRYDPQTPPACSEELAHLLPHARLILFEKSGHSPFLEEPEQFGRTLSLFLRA